MLRLLLELINGCTLGDMLGELEGCFFELVDGLMVGEGVELLVLGKEGAED